MKNDLNIGAFTELTGTEAEMVDGGGIFSNVLDIVGTTIKAIALPFPFVGPIVIGITDLVMNSIEAIASPIYTLIGWEFRGPSPLLNK